MNLRVLIVEDEKALADILEYNFKKEGYKTIYLLWVTKPIKRNRKENKNEQN